MGINLNGSIGSLYLGSTKIVEAYLGSVKVFGSSSPVIVLPAKTIRFKFSNTNYQPTTGSGGNDTSKIGTWTVVNTSQGIWDWYYNNTSWGSDARKFNLISTNIGGTVDILAGNLDGVTSTLRLFGGTSGLPNDGLNSVSGIYNTTSLLDMESMFEYCTSLKSVTLFDTSNVTNMMAMFNDCTSLTSVPLFNTGNVTDMGHMFTSCTSLTTVPLFVTNNVYNMFYMFNGCRSLTSVPLFNTSNVTDMGYMFDLCRSLTSVPFFNTGNVTNMMAMFSGCNSLTTVPLFNTGNVTNMLDMFYGCTSLTTVPLFDTSSVGDMSRMFYKCRSVESGALSLYQQASTQTTPPIFYTACFYNCGIDTTTGAAELAQIPSDWK